MADSNSTKVIRVSPPEGRKIVVAAEPEAVEVDVRRSAVVVVDMQNAFVKEGGMFDLRGFDVKPTQRIIEPIKSITTRAKQMGMKVVYVAHVLSPELAEVGPEASFWYKSVRLFRESPEWRDRFIIRGTWGARIVDELAPEADDLYVEKTRFSAFFGTNLDTLLKTYGIKNLFFTGCSTNVCVEAGIRDAANLNYFPFLLTDATMNNGPAFTQDATIHNVKLCFGWVTTSENLFKAWE